MEKKETQGVKEEMYTKEQVQAFIQSFKDQIMYLSQKLQDKAVEDTFKRLELLFKCIDHEIYFDKDFIDKCVVEIKDIMTVPEEEAEEEEK